MSKFKVGDRARLVAIRSEPRSYWKPGLEVVVIAVGPMLDRSGNPCDYRVKTDAHPDKMGGAVLYWQLEPLTPDLGSWEEIARTIKWKPEAVQA